MHFQHPGYLLLLVLLTPMAVLFGKYYRWKKQRISRIGNPLLVAELIKTYSQRNFKLRALIAATVIGLLVLALAGLRRPQGEDSIQRKGMDIMIALDVSKSMLARDVEPSRLERAKQFLYRLIDHLPDDRFGMVVFAGKAYLQLPLTTDHAAAKMYLSSVSPEAIPTQGTVLNEALKMCYSGFSPHEKKYRTIILVSDGEDHDQGAAKIAAELSDAGILIHTIGIGSAAGTTLTDPVTGLPKLDAAGKPVISRLNEDLLRKIAQTTGGVYTRFSSPSATADALEKQLQGMERTQITDKTLGSYRLYFQWFLLAAILLLVLETLLPEHKGNRHAFLLLFFVGLFPGLKTEAQESLDQIRKGNVLYEKKQFREAAAIYEKAVGDATQQGNAFYNLGNALYKDNRPEEAVRAYDKAIGAGGTHEQKGTAWYNKGVVLQQQKKLSDCIGAYKNALRLNPRDEEARLNLQQALQQQLQQQPPPQPPKKDSPKKDKQTEQPPQPPPAKMTKREAEEKLRALMQRERNLHEKFRTIKAVGSEKPEKDW